MKIPREKKTGKFIGEGFEGKEFWISLYYDYGEFDINITPIKVIIEEVSDHRVKITPVSNLDQDKKNDIDRIIFNPGYGLIDYFDTYEEAVYHYNECLSNEIGYCEDKIKNISDLFIKL
jgi:hypothetical protein